MSTALGGRGLTSLLRMTALATLAALVVWGVPGSDARAGGGLGAPAARTLATASLGASGWDDAVAHAAEAPLTAVLSGRPSAIVVETPRRVRAERTAALRVRAVESAEVVLRHPEGTTDTLRLDAGRTGAFLVHPFSPGWRSWRLEVAATGAAPVGTEWGTLVLPARPLRILAISGPPGPEPAAALRALEEAGEEVEAWTHLGRGLWVGREAAELPTDPEAYAPFDVVVLFPGISVSPASARALLGAVRELGKGLLLAGGTGEAPALGAAVTSATGLGPWNDEIAVTGDVLAWRLPPEVTPLPALPVDTRILVPVPDTAGDGGPGPTPLALGSLGLGRLGALALPDSWVWRMGGGAVDAHRTFWSDVASWLAGGFQDEVTLELLAADVRRGEHVLVRHVRRSVRSDEPAPPGRAAAPPTLLLRTPSASRPVETVAHVSPPTANVSLAALVPGEVGAHVLGQGDDDAEAALSVPVAPEGEPGLDPEGYLARVALSSPGGSVVVDAARATAGPEAGSPAWPWRAILFSLLALLLITEWTRRRLLALP